MQTRKFFKKRMWKKCGHRVENRKNAVEYQRGGAAAMFGTALVAALYPAWRSSRVPPAVTSTTSPTAPAPRIAFTMYS